MTLRTPAVSLLVASLVASTALAQAPDTGMSQEQEGLRPFNPEELATPPPSWQTPSPQPAPEATSPPSATDKAQPQQTWYGWNFCLIDPLAIGAMGYGVFGNRPDLLLSGTTVYVLNGPLLHILLHGRFLHAAHSLGYRLLAPLASLLALGTLVGAIGQKICSTDVCIRNQIVGLVGLGVFAAWGADLTDSLEPGDRGTLTAGINLRFD